MTISKKDQERLSRLSEAAERPGVLPPGATLRGSQATAEARRLLADALGGHDEVEKALRPGPKSLDGSQNNKGPSPVIRVRIPADRDVNLARLEQAVHRNRSELIREAIDLLLERYGATEPPDTKTREAGLREAREHLNAAMASLEALEALAKSG